MGKRIDRAVLGIATATGYYLFFLNAWRSVPMAWGAAFLCCALTGYLLEKRPPRRRMSAPHARAALARIAELTDKEAESALAALLRRRYPGESFRLVPVLKHPEASLSSGDILNAWKANRDADRLVVAATCPCEARAALYARELKAPLVAIVDSRAVTRLLRRYGEVQEEAPQTALSARLRRFLLRVSTSRASPRNALLAVALLALYCLRGNLLNLAAALALLFHLGVTLIHRRPRRRLFDPT